MFRARDDRGYARFGLWAILASVLGLATGIGAGQAEAREQLHIVGSSTVYPFATAVAEHFASDGFKAPVVESTGTGGGMKLF